MKTSFALSLAFAAPIVCSSGACSSDDSSKSAPVLDASIGAGDDSGITPCTPRDAALPAPSAQCKDLATAYCKQEAKCDTVTMQAYFAGDMAACVGRAVVLCPSVSEPGTSNTPASIASCATAVDQLADCTAFASYLLANDGLLCASVPGALADGSPCQDDAQCQGGLCGYPPPDSGALTGDAGASGFVCSAKPGAPGCVKNAQCPAGQLCTQANTCVAAGAAGAPCDDSLSYQAMQPCQGGLYCATVPMDGGLAAKQCATLAGMGAACNASDDVNDCQDGLHCAASACATITFAAVGAACGGTGVVCAAGACKLNADGGYACVALVPDGSPCTNNSDCELGASCYGGYCTSDPNACF